MVKKILLGLGALLGLALLGGAGYVGLSVSAYSASMDKVYDVPIPQVKRTTDPAQLARGKHLLESLGACSNTDCHGADLGGGKIMDAGPLGRMVAPNITEGGKGGEYSDGELFRLIKHGIKRDGRSVRFMPSQDFA